MLAAPASYCEAGLTLYCWYLIQAEVTPVYIAAGYGNVDMLNMLIDAGGDVNIATVVSLYNIHVTVYWIVYTFCSVLQGDLYDQKKQNGISNLCINVYQEFIIESI